MTCVYNEIHTPLEIRAVVYDLLLRFLQVMISKKKRNTCLRPNIIIPFVLGLMIQKSPWTQTPVFQSEKKREITGSFVFKDKIC